MTSVQDRPLTIDPRIAARRRQVARDIGKRRRGRLLAFLIVLVSIAAIIGLIRSPLLDLDDFEVTATRHVTAEEVIAASGVRHGDALATLDAGTVRARLLALPWVADASVAVSWPGTLRLAVTERIPVATLATGGGWMLVDEHGRVLGAATTAPADDATGPVPIEGVPVPAPGAILDGSAQRALAVAMGLSPGVRTRVDAVVMAPDGRFTLRLRPGGIALIGVPTDLENTLLALQTTLAQVDLTDLETIDLRVPGQAVVSRTSSNDSSASRGGDQTSTAGG